jgi:7-carboxy-7-deazaguanine synthase
MKVVEIFNSIDGEGKRVGLPCTFIRLFGCNLSCSYCDSQYACKEEKSYYTIMSINEIISYVNQWDCKNITVTGGEPLLHTGIKELLKRLILDDYYVNVETNGTIIPPVRGCDSYKYNIFYTIDYKCNTSGMSDKMNTTLFEKHIWKEDVVKFVVGSQEDMIQALEVCEKYNLHNNIYISPVFGQIEPKGIVNFIQQHCLWDWHVQVQLHKILWDPDERGV